MTLTRWFRQHQRYMIAGLVILLMASWGVLSTVKSLVREPTAQRTIHGRAVQQADVTDAERALHMMAALRLIEYVTPAVMESRGAPLRATVKMETLATDFRDFVLPGQNPSVSFEAGWRYLVLLYQAEAAGVEVTEGEVKELLDSLPQFSDQNGFNRVAYANMLASYGLADADMARWFTQMCRIAKLLIMHRQAVQVSNSELWMAYVYSAESVRIRYVEVDGSLFRPLVQVTDEELTEFYEDHRDVLPAESPDGIGYKAPERVKAEYALIPIDQAAKQVQVSDEEVASYYNEHKEDYRIPEEPKAQPEDQKPEEPRYKPLEEVRDDVRQKLAAPRAKAQADRQADAIMADLEAVRANYENMPQPLEQMARRHGAEFQTVKTAGGRGLVSKDELAALVPGGPGLAQFAFEVPPNLYLPHKVDSDRGPVIFQMLDYHEPEVQPYADVEAQVHADCLQQKAVESARTFAAKLKERADGAGLEVAAAEMTQRLDNLLKTPEGKEPPVLKVQESASFRRISQSVVGIEGNTQEGLIRAAFALGDKQTAVATTGTPPASVLVIQVSERTPASPEGFAKIDPMTRVLYQTQKQRRLLQAWMQGLLDKSPMATKVQG